MEHVAWTTSLIQYSQQNGRRDFSDCTPYKTSQVFVILAELKSSGTTWESRCLRRENPEITKSCQPFLEAKHHFKVLAIDCHDICNYDVWQGMSINFRLIMQLWILLTGKRWCHSSFGSDQLITFLVKHWQKLSLLWLPHTQRHSEERLLYAANTLWDRGRCLKLLQRPRVVKRRRAACDDIRAHGVNYHSNG